jgi:hypothetical protein
MQSGRWVFQLIKGSSMLRGAFKLGRKKKQKKTLDALHYRGACIGPLLLAAIHSHVLCITSLSLGSYLITYLVCIFICWLVTKLIDSND